MRMPRRPVLVRVGPSRVVFWPRRFSPRTVLSRGRGDGTMSASRVGAKRCAVAHVGLIVSGTATAALEDGRIFELRAGELFYIPEVPHDSWVVGSEPYVSLHFLGADHYAK